MKFTSRVRVLAVLRKRMPDRPAKNANALRYARRTAVLRAHESAQDLEASAKRLLADLAAKGAGQERVRAFRAAFAAHTDVTRRRRVVSEMLAALEQLERSPSR